VGDRDVPEFVGLVLRDVALGDPHLVGVEVQRVGEVGLDGVGVVDQLVETVPEDVGAHLHRVDAGVRQAVGVVLQDEHASQQLVGRWPLERPAGHARRDARVLERRQESRRPEPRHEVLGYEIPGSERPRYSLVSSNQSHVTQVRKRRPAVSRT
jgi:hypothetical protein